MNKSRRDFFRIVGGSAGLAAMPLSIRKAFAIPAHRRAGTIQDVEHVVILMQENRSFDHYFGSLRGVRGFNDPRPVRLSSGKPVWYQPVAQVKTKHYQHRGLAEDAEHVLPWYLNPQRTTEFQAGTDHGWSSGHLAWNQGHYDQWVTQKQDVLTMGHLKREDVSFHYALADAFTLCDAYFCSAHSHTAINRIYLWSGTCDPQNIYGKKKNGPGLDERNKRNGYTWTTYPERLEDAKVSWRVYQGGTGIPGTPTDNYTDNSLEFFSQYQVEEGALPSSSLVKNGVSNHTLKDFRRDVVSGQLPQVSWIVAPYKYCEHPEASPTDGAYFINLVLEALTSNSDVWSKTVFLINYDENDGLFDHVVPPMPPHGSGQNANGLVSDDLVESLRDEFVDLDVYSSEKKPLVPGADPGGRQPIGLGPRVPMLIVSPWTKGGWLCSQVFDHTSVLQFLEARFGVRDSNISQWRRAVCGDLTAAFDFSVNAEDSRPQITVPAAILSKHQPYRVPANQVMPQQEPGTRPSRPLLYQFTTECRFEKDKLWIGFINSGPIGAAFYAYANHEASAPPRRYAVSGGRSIFDYWILSQESSYDICIYGPNGYLSRFRGDHVPATMDCKMSGDGASERLSLSLTSRDTLVRTMQISDAYKINTTVELKLEPGASLQYPLQETANGGWFDLSVTCASYPNYLRRYAGRLETGRPGISDPGVFQEERAILWRI